MIYSLVSKKAVEQQFSQITLTRVEAEEEFSGWIITSSMEDLNFSAEEDLIPISNNQLAEAITQFAQVSEDGKLGDVFVFNSGFETLVRLENKATKYVSTEALATNQGLIKVNLFQWIRYNRMLFQSELALLFLGPFLLIIFPKIGFLFLLGIGYMIWQLYQEFIEVKEIFQMGNIIPGIVIQTNPVLIGTVTNVSKGLGSYPVARIDNYALFTHYHKGNVKKGDRIPMLAIYYEYKGSTLNYWNDYQAWPVEFATKNRELIHKKYYSIAEKDWLHAETSLQQLSTKKVASLTPIDVANSAWQQEPNQGFPNS